jgi:hypothetical protein
MRLADTLDHIVIFTGDGDFRALVAALQQKGKRVSVVSTLQTQPPMVADELRRQSDQFIDLADLEQLICRDPSSRPPRPEGTDRRFATRRDPVTPGAPGARNPAQPVAFDDAEDMADDEDVRSR